MNGNYRIFSLSAALCALLALPAWAMPILSVTDTGLNGSGNREWLVEVAPDASLFTDPDDNPDRGLGGSVAVELAFAIDDTEIVGVTPNTTDWPADNPGFNPFTGTITDGLWIDLIADQTFGAFGSIFFTSGDPVELMTIETLSNVPATVRYGVAASNDLVEGARIVQADTNFDGYTGSVTATIPEPAAVTLVIVGFAACCLRRWRTASM